MSNATIVVLGVYLTIVIVSLLYLFNTITTNRTIRKIRNK